MMLVQNPTKIFKSDFAVWKKQNSCVCNELIFGEEHSKLRKVTEIIFDESGNYNLKYTTHSTVLIIILYGEIIINDFEKPVSSDQIFTLKSSENGILYIKNNLSAEKSDILVLELKNESSENSFIIENLALRERNTLIQITENLGCPNFIGLYDGRKEQEYQLYQKGNSVFGMVVNGAFEFQNRLMETRDAILLTETESLEFEALSQNALLLFFEV